MTKDKQHGLNVKLKIHNAFWYFFTVWYRSIITLFTYNW